MSFKNADVVTLSPRPQLGIKYMNSRFSNNKSLYLRNDARYRHGQIDEQNEIIIVYRTTPRNLQWP